MSLRFQLRANPEHSFRGFRVGPIIVAMLLVNGVYGVVHGLQGPLAAIAIDIFNFLAVRARADVVPIFAPSFSWALSLGYLCTGGVLIVTSIRLGFWLEASRNGAA